MQPVTTVTANPQKVQHPTPQQRRQWGGAGDDDWQQALSALQTPGHAPAPVGHAPSAGSKPLTKQMSKDLFPWLSEPDQKKSVVVQPVLPNIAQKSSPLKVCVPCSLYICLVMFSQCVMFVEAYWSNEHESDNNLQNMKMNYTFRL